ncbi:MAG: hypothetical protein LBN23_00960, partial [Paludibacter sp.]|nr:hypothetical protein [Paludibacter sp.]
MKQISFISIISVVMLLASCNEWDKYYSADEKTSSAVEIVNQDIETYIKGQSNLSSISALLQSGKIYESINRNGGYTVIVCGNEILNQIDMANTAQFVKNSVSDVSIPPVRLTDGFGITTRLGKNVWINVKDGVYFDNFKLEKAVKTTNGYVYYVGGAIPVRLSIYDYLNSLGDDYSYFKSIVARYEENYFDKDKSTPISVDAVGNTVYDTVWTRRNLLIDRYSESGLKTWDMFS